MQDVGFLEDVEPQRRLSDPPVLCRTDLLGAQRSVSVGAPLNGIVHWAPIELALAA